MTFFAAIAASDYETAFNLRLWEPRPGMTSREEAFSKFVDDYSTTTYDSNITIDNFRYDGADILVDVGFVSHQAADKAPPGAGTCTRWDLYYRMEQTSGTWLIMGAKGRSDPGYAPC